MSTVIKSFTIASVLLTASLVAPEAGAAPFGGLVPATAPLVETVQNDPCLHYHPSVGYYNGCTRQGARMTRNFDRQYYGRYGYGGGGYNYGYGAPVYQARPPYDPCLHFHPSRGYYRVC